jgi:hypothetical protein
MRSDTQVRSAGEDVDLGGREKGSAEGRGVPRQACVECRRRVRVPLTTVDGVENQVCAFEIEREAGR